MAEGNPVASGRVTLLNDCGLHKTKVVPFEKLNLKSVNKVKLDNFRPSYDPFKEVCFFHFPGFTDFERAVTLLLVKINFKF